LEANAPFSFLFLGEEANGAVEEEGEREVSRNAKGGELSGRGDRVGFN
jgi:hypothetical protein